MNGRRAVWRLATLTLFAATALLVSVAGCRAVGGRGPDLVIAASSAHRSLAPEVERFARERGYRIEIAYLGSVDIALALLEGDARYDAVWPAHSYWLAVGDEDARRLRHVASIVRSPLAYGVRFGAAARLGLAGREVPIGEVLDAVAAGDLRLATADAARSHVGALAYLAALSENAGAPPALTAEHLRGAGLVERLGDLYDGAARAPASAGWLLEHYLAAPERYDGLVNAEALLIEANREAVRLGREPLYLVYPLGGQGVLDSPLAYVERGEAHRERVYLALQAHLLGDEAQAAFRAAGWRTGLVALEPGGDAPEAEVDPRWGVDTARTIRPLRFPAREVLREALNLYLAAVRPPALAVYVVDRTQSMAGEGERDLEEALRALLDQGEAAAHWAPIGPRDVTAVLAFGAQAEGAWIVEGNDQAALAGLLARALAEEPAGHGDVYLPIVEARRLVEARAGERPAGIVLLTIGRSRTGANLRLVRRAWEEGERPLPVYAVLLGDAEEAFVRGLVEVTGGEVFVGPEWAPAAARRARWGSGWAEE